MPSPQRQEPSCLADRDRQHRGRREPERQRGRVERRDQADAPREVQLDQRRQQHVRRGHPAQGEQREREQYGDGVGLGAQGQPDDHGGEGQQRHPVHPDEPGQRRGERAEGGEGEHRQRGQHAGGRRGHAEVGAHLVQDRADAHRGRPEVEGEDDDADRDEDPGGPALLGTSRRRHRVIVREPAPADQIAGRVPTLGRCVNNPSSKPHRSSGSGSATPSGAGCGSPATATSPGRSSAPWSAARVPVAYSSGFNPHPRISYANAAPTGAASEGEYLEIGLARDGRPRVGAHRARRGAARRSGHPRGGRVVRRVARRPAGGQRLADHGAGAAAVPRRPRRCSGSSTRSTSRSSG